MAQYLGVDVLEREPDGRVAKSDAFFREIVPVGSPFGRVDQDDHQGVSGTVREYLWCATTTQAVTALRTFLLARRGRAYPFWLPTLNHDLTLSGDKLAADDSINVKTVGYASFFFPGTDARRQLSIRPSDYGSVPIYRKVLNAVDNLDGTETLYLDSALGVDVKAALAMISFLRLCRLEDDVTKLEFQGRGYCESRIRMRELPNEVTDPGVVIVPPPDPPPDPTGYGYDYGIGYGGVSG